MRTHETDVLIVGGGPVGLAMALDLRHRGVDCALTEATDGSAHVAVSTIGQRSMELFRRWGVAHRIRTAGWPDDHPLDVAWVTQAGGHEVLRVPRGTAGDRPASPYSPEHDRICPAHWLNPLLMEALGTHPDGPVRLRHRVVEWKQTDDHVLATVADLARDTTHTIRARYLVACDGASSPVRKACGIAAPDRYEPQVFRNILFRAPRLRTDLEARGHRSAMVYFLLLPPAMRYPMRAMDGAGIYNLTVGGEAAGSREEAHSLVQRAFAFPTPVEVLSDAKWCLTHRVADRYRSGRVFLVGDAAHTLSPSGGFGLNTGIADAADLGWKLAAELAGWAGPGLLDSYDTERRPIALWNLEEANTNLTRTTRRKLPAELGDDTPVGRRARAALAEAMEREHAGREFDAPDVHVGFRYHSPIIAEESEEERRPRATAPGSRAPHLWLGPDTSTLDLFSAGFHLLALGPEDSVDGVAKIERAFTDRGVPLDTTALVDPAVAEAYGSRLVLVRPDGHVAWRGDEPPASPEALVDLVRGVVHP